MNNDDAFDNFCSDNSRELDNDYAEYIAGDDWGSGEDKIDTSYGSAVHEEWLNERFEKHMESFSDYIYDQRKC